MHEDKIFEILRQAIRSETGDMASEITPETTALDVSGWDSLAHGRIIMTVESELSTRIDMEATYRAANLAELCAIIRESMMPR
jgi:acyl carrier protein